MKKQLLVPVLLFVCGCGNSGVIGLATAKVLCNESKLAGSGRSMTEAEWGILVENTQQAFDTGASRELASSVGIFTCGGEVLCVRCSEALIDAIWP